MTKDLLNDLPRFKATAKFESQLFESSRKQAGNASSSPAYILYAAPFAMAASLAVGLLIGGTEIAWLSESLSSLGLIGDVSYGNEIDVYASTFSTLGG